MIIFRSRYYLITFVAVITITLTSYAQDEGKSTSWSAGADFVSTYVWRGTRQGAGPHIQPVIEFSAGRFTAGAWGTVNFRDYEEADLYFSFRLPAGLAVGMQDYYLPELDYFDYSALSGSHAFEINLDYAGENVSMSANYVINQAGGIGTYGGDLYFEAGLSFDYFSVFMGAGTGWHTLNGTFNVCNIGISTAREIKITDNFSIPVTGQFIFNPDAHKIYVVAGFTF